MATHDIYLYEAGSDMSLGITIPWLPQTIEVDMGELRVMEYEILDQGPVEIPNGSNLGTIQFSSIFPGTGRDLPFLRGSKFEPRYYVDQINTWKQNGTKIRITMTNSGIDYDVYVAAFITRRAGGYGDVEYEITLKTRRDALITTITQATTTTDTKNQTKSETSTGTSYTIKSGDSLWGIAVKYLGSGSRWTEIYALNKDIIESTAKSKRGGKGSDNGKYIYPGVTIKIPEK